MPEQHEGDDVQSSFALRHVPCERHWPAMHVVPAQHSVGWLHDSLS